MLAYLYQSTTGILILSSDLGSRILWSLPKQRAKVGLSGKGRTSGVDNLSGC